MKEQKRAPRRFMWAFVLCVLLWSVLDAAVAFAVEDGAAAGVKDHPRSMPRLPLISPQLLPSLTFGYHRDSALPTVAEKWIDVDLSEQRVVAYEGVTPVRAFIVSTGLPRTPTVTGEYRIRMKVRSQTMSGPGYYLPNVEWVQYFYQGYAFHGTYWHNKFGQPMSHGCVNMTNREARWLFEWAAPAFDGDGPTWQRPASDTTGTLVFVHK